MSENRRGVGAPPRWCARRGDPLPKGEAVVSAVAGDDSLSGHLVLVVVWVATLGDDAADQGDADEDEPDRAGRPLGCLDVVQLGNHHAAQEQDRPHGAVLQVLELGERAGAQQVDRHGPNPHSAGTEAGHDQDDRRGDRECADDSVEGERRVQDLQTEEHAERGDAGQQLLLVLGLQDGAEEVEAEVQGEGDDRGNEDGHAGRGVFGYREVHHDRGDDHQERGDVVVPTERRQALLQPADPVLGLLLVEEVGDAEHDQEGAAERVDDRGGFRELVGVQVRVVQRQVDHLGEAEVGRELHDEDRQRETDQEHGDEDADGHEHELPARAEPLEQLAVHDRVVEAERHFQDRQDDDLERVRETALPGHGAPDEERCDGGEPVGAPEGDLVAGSGCAIGGCHGRIPLSGNRCVVSVFRGGSATRRLASYNEVNHL